MGQMEPVLNLKFHSSRPVLSLIGFDPVLTRPVPGPTSPWPALTGVNGVQEHIMKILEHCGPRLICLNPFWCISFLTLYLSSYRAFEISYNIHKENWSINKLLTMYVQEEGRLLIKMGECVDKEGRRNRSCMRKIARHLFRMALRKSPSAISVKRKGT